MTTQQLIDQKIAVDNKIKNAKNILNSDVYNLLLLLSDVLECSIKDRMLADQRVKELKDLSKKVDDLIQNGYDDQAGEEWKKW